jgi:hypothetical protein
MKDVKDENRIFFCARETGISQLDGVLELDLTLSAKMGETGPESWLRPFCLPVPKETQINGRWRVLPGAAMAFVKARGSPDEPVFDAYADTKSLGVFCRAQKEFPESVVREIEEYYSSEEVGSRVRSFVSLALGSSTPIVINIHAATTGILRQDIEQSGQRSGPTKQFVYLVEPLLLMVLELSGILDSPPAEGVEHEKDRSQRETGPSHPGPGKTFGRGKSSRMIQHIFARAIISR